MFHNCNADFFKNLIIFTSHLAIFYITFLYIIYINHLLFFIAHLLCNMFNLISALMYLMSKQFITENPQKFKMHLKQFSN